MSTLALVGVLVHSLADGPPPDGTLVLGKTMRQHPVDGDERHCPRCDDWWPADGEFFVQALKARHGLSAWCKACLSEDRNAKRRARQAS